MAARFRSIDDLCAGLGGTKPIHKLLIANNGLAAVKGIQSIRGWLHDHVDDVSAVSMCVMAAQEDLKINAEFIRLADRHVEVPGGKNVNNYANVDLILSTAAQLRCDAVYPGWGHASENPALPRGCVKSGSITFLGPHEGAMFALGDKIASTIIAQSNGVPTVAWSGDSIRLAENTYVVDEDVYAKAYIATADECVAACERIGFPVMIKASGGGGGKGIRKVTRKEEVASAYVAVAEEVRDSPIFAMKMLTNVRHLEVQLLADAHGNCIAVRTRDCSVQRRHQKVIEEGPVVEVAAELILQMEAAAIRLAKAVGYVGLGTVEYMYDMTTKTFCFLELNPRIQVEHPISELISGVNLPAALLCVGMGIPLYRIPEVRAFYGETPYGDSVIDFTTRSSLPPKCHAIAVRVTAEDVDEGFRPTTGTIDEISFSNSKECWGYFSVPSGGGIHQFADSQFGHIFATGATREEARRKMVLALRSTHIRGEIRTSHGYIIELLERQEFRDSLVSTAWLDGLIAERSGKRDANAVFPALCAASVVRMRNFRAANQRTYVTAFRGGHTPSTELLANRRQEVFVYNNTKYTIDVSCAGPNTYTLAMNGSTVTIPWRECGFGLQMLIAGRTVVAYGEEEPDGLRVTINGAAMTFTGDVDHTKLRSAVPGRLIRFLVEDGGHIEDGGAFAEVEVMKMILPLKSAVSGTIRHTAVPGSTIAVGKLLAEVEPDDITRVARTVDCTDGWPAGLTAAAESVDRVDGVLTVRLAIDALWQLLQGYCDGSDTPQALAHRALEGLASLASPSVTLGKLAATRDFLLPYVSEADDSAPYVDKMARIVQAIADAYLAVETRFDKLRRDAAVTRLRDEELEAEEVFAMDFAHHHTHRQEIICTVLRSLEQNRKLMVACLPTYEALGRLQQVAVHGPVLMQVRYLTRLCQMPSLDERKAELCAALANGDHDRILAGSFGTELLISVIFDPSRRDIIHEAMQHFLKRSYFGVATLDNIDLWVHEQAWFGRYTFESLRSQQYGHESPSSGVGFVAHVGDEQDAARHLPRLLETAVSGKEPTVVTAFFSVRNCASQSEASARCAKLLADHKARLAASSVEYITFIVSGVTSGPYMFTFRRSIDFAEDDLLRNLVPTTAHRLELTRFKNFTMSMLATPYRQVHIFSATPKRPKFAAVEARLFVRHFVTPRDLGVEPESKLTQDEIAHVLQMCISAAEFARSDRKVSTTVHNHMFVNFIELQLDISGILTIFRNLEESFAKKLFSLGFREMECRFIVRTSAGPMPFRVIIVNPTGHATSIRSYVELEEQGATILQRAEYRDDIADISTMWESQSCLDAMDISGNTPTAGAAPSMPTAASDMDRLSAVREMLPVREHAGSLASLPASGSGSDPLEKRMVLAPYPNLSERQVKRLSALVMGTTYAHDWMLHFEVALRRQWRALLEGRNLPRKAFPAVPLSATQMTVRDGQLVPGDVAPGVAMVAWVVEYFPPSYYDVATGRSAARKIVAVANDITVNSGSFAVPEDAVFKAASDYARARGLPFVYFSSNSGARLGLSNEVKKVFRVAHKGDGFEYIYLTPEDYAALTAKGVAVAVEEVTTAEGEKRFRITDIIGEGGDYLGVENLQGSALIAGHMSLNYGTIPTISVVSGRSVGIGAYLVRLGKRVVQANNAPIILTGYVALNRLLGKEVYQDNSQLGGGDIMCPNGVTHWGVSDDLEAVKATLQWLDFVPAVTDGSIVRAPLTLAKEDPIDRDVTFTPAKATPYDPRCLVEGCADAGTTGMFDKGSWVESQTQWAKTVVTGRATLGGLPCGVILVETRVTKKYNPADPATADSAASLNPQAGQVWFPDSARKTADALEDFQHESLPCFIVANWRGFSGGMRDMFDEVLKFGASIVDNLRTYSHPVYIYIPPFGELRGGAWVVVDPVINHCGAVEMYCDATARGGILEPSGVVEIKFREADLRELIRRCDPEVRALAASDAAEATRRETNLLPRYSDVAVHFADLHDTPGRMKAKGCVVDVVPWAMSRRIFYQKLRARMHEMELGRRLVSGGAAADLAAGIAAVKALAAEHGAADDVAVFTAAPLVAAVDGLIAKARAADLVAKLSNAADLKAALAASPALRDTLAKLLAE